MKVQNNTYFSIEQLKDQYLNQSQAMAPARADEKSFRQILESQKNAEGQVKFSKHAAGRLADRNIELTENQLDRLTEGTQKAGAKGIKESLVIVDQLAFIVNVPSSTVVTAMNRQDAAENIFTNIDGAVII